MSETLESMAIDVDHKQLAERPGISSVGQEGGNWRAEQRRRPLPGG
ncbi:MULTISPECIES: hypothetical protein [Mycolicibacterium]|jgi:hypothetical protein|nr:MULTISPECIES: hypothetical protein [Mycolicibacterium]MDW5613852.1 hypothetical protein [Mycolicibacterium sp. D5.8-2]QZT58749.1 hypothetical protein JN084_09350 [Mycolicibacterium austroafricanum]QZY48006.1 hypothetical protein K5L12_10050 [Mycolicibacterium austroafricanum]UJL26520.1 hypothetical protein HZU38_16040 [Mycolicibacterium vanbaalenii]WND58616.1 hypothetical protein QQA43_09645 [Mycolicibacterium vanbaalenii]